MVIASSKALRFSRRWTTLGIHPFEQVAFEQRTARITDPQGNVVFEMDGVEVPAFWSQLATDILASKYLRKAGVPNGGSEMSLKQILTRIVHTIRTEGETRGVFASPADADTFEMELIYLLLHQMGAFNSPVWFNCGLWQAYGIEGNGGNWFWNPQTGQVEQATNAYEHPQCAACFIQTVPDDLMGIFELMKIEARIFKYGSGSGANYSKIRGRQEHISSGGHSSGLMSFLDVLDRAAGATKSGGTTRRAAKMVCLDMDHPEIMDFINWKKREERKVHALIAAGYSSDFNGEAYQTVSGQNSNNSVRLSDAFMNAYLNDQPWQTRFRTTGEVCETFSAKDLMRQVAEAAWACADPGVQFDDTINRWHTCADTDRIYGSNPCSEFHFLDETACNLASINLLKFLQPDSTFDAEGFQTACRLFFTAQEILVDFASYPTQAIAQNSHDYRPLGLGYANLGALLMQSALPYDSQPACAFAGAITALMHGTALQTSAELAAALGAFPKYAQNERSLWQVMHQHQQALAPMLNQLAQHHPQPKLDEALQTTWHTLMAQGRQYGFRHAQVTVLAPTGTISLLMDCDTTGIEPEFSLVKWKKLAGGGTLQLVNQSVAEALKRLGYSADDIALIEAHIEATGTVEDCPTLKPEHLPVFDCANSSGQGKRFIEPWAHLRMMAAVQPFLSGAISKTVNLPHQATVETIEALYVDAWRMGLKCVALYRDGSKFSQPLSTQAEAEDEDLPQSDAPPCAQCGYQTVLDGACYVCKNCGQSVSCS